MSNEKSSTGARPRGTVRRLPDGRWKIGIRLPGRPRAFETVPGSEGWTKFKAQIYAAGKTAELEKAAAGKAYLDALVAKATAGETLGQYSDRWLAERAARGLASAPDDGSRLGKWVLPGLGARSITAITRRDLEELVERLDVAARDGVINWKTSIHIWSNVAKLFDDATNGKALALRVLEHNPAAGVRGPDRGLTKAKQYLYPTELLAVLTCPSVPLAWRRLMALSVYLYTRASELDALEWGDVDVARGIVHVHQSFNRKRTAIKGTKTGGTRRFSVEPCLLPLLRVLHSEAGGQGRVVAQPMRLYGRCEKLREFMRAAGVDRPDLYRESETAKQMTWHDLRATGLTWLAVRGDEPLRIKQRAGHSTFSTTEGYIRTAEAIRDGFGEVFPSLPQCLLGSHIGSQIPKCSKLQWAQQDSKATQPPVMTSIRGVTATVPAPAERPNDDKCAMPGSGSSVEPPLATVEDALAVALERASRAGQWDVVQTLATELQARRLTAAGVAVLPTAKRSP